MLTRQIRFSLLVLLLGVVVSPAALDAASVAGGPHVRALDDRVRELLHVGSRQSRTFHDLMDSLEGSNVIVYIEARPIPERRFSGTTRLVVQAGGVRYVRIRVTLRSSVRQNIALLAHELQHAREMAWASWVVDAETCAALYRTIGFATCADHACYDTRDAIRVGYRVLAELAEVTHVAAAR
jgi:hypothetical protein